jgi:CheY-like chemotaxis protein
MATKKCIILSKSTTIWSVFQSYGYETIVLSDSSTFTTILTTIPPNLVVIDSDVQNGADLLPAVFQLPQPPESVTIRDDSTLPLPAGQERLVRVGTQISEADWWKIIQQNNTLAESIQSIPEVTKKDKILVIDDVVELIDMYKIMFEMKGYEVETAKDWLEWITKAVSFQPKYILLDIMMPHMDWFALMKTFRENTSLDSVIIVNSNIDTPNVTEKIYAAGADYYIRKSDYVPTQIVYMIEQGMFANKRKAPQ